jgi:hypothetical protein
MRAVAGSIVILGGCVLFGCGIIAETIIGASYEARANTPEIGWMTIWLGVVMAVVGALVAFTGRNSP